MDTHHSSTRRKFLKDSMTGSLFVAFSPVLFNAVSCSNNLESKALHQLLNALHSGDPVIQAHAASLLGELKAEVAVGPLVEYVTDCRYYAKTAGFNALMAIGDKTVIPDIAPLIEKPNVPIDLHWYQSICVQSAAALTNIVLGGNDGGSEGASFFDRVRIEKGVDWKFFIFCLWYSPFILQLPGTSPALMALKQLTRKLVFNKRFYQAERATMAARAMAVIKGAEAGSHLRWYIHNFQSRYVRGHGAFNLLLAENSEQNAAFLSDIYKNDITEFVKIQSAAGLYNAGRDDHLDYIIDRAGKASDIIDRTTAIEALGLKPADQGNKVLADNLHHTDPYVRLCAIESLGKIKDHELPGIEQMLTNEEDIRVQLQAARYVLGRNKEV